MLFLFLAVCLKVCSHYWLSLELSYPNPLHTLQCIQLIAKVFCSGQFFLSYLGSNDMLCCFPFSLCISRCIHTTAYLWVILAVMTCCAVSLSRRLSQGVFTPLVAMFLWPLETITTIDPFQSDTLCKVMADHHFGSEVIGQKLSHTPYSRSTAWYVNTPMFKLVQTKAEDSKRWL